MLGVLLKSFFQQETRNKIYLNVIVVVDSWGKIPSGILEGNVHEQGSFSECMNLERNAQQYASQYCLAKITVKIPGLLQSKQADHVPEMETRNAIPM